VTATTEAPPESAIPTTDEIPEPEGVVTLGSLSLSPTQTKLTPEQRAALSAITNANPDDERAIPNLRVFLHVCQKMSLDPWRKQAYLIVRGEGDKAKFTIQVGIDGYRTVAARTRLLVGSATWLWTGDDDDPACWRFNEATGVMQRVWYDEWPESRGWPGAAKAVIRHYDALGNLVISDAVAHWGMYAPMYPKFEWTGSSGSRKKVPVVDDDGKTVMELGEMWAKGPAHMLAKCAEALVLRKVFPDEFAGTVTFEEMHRADMEERVRADREAAAARKEAFSRVLSGTGEDVGEPEPEPGTPAADADDVADGVIEPGADTEPSQAPESAQEPAQPQDAAVEEDGPHAFVQDKRRKSNPECQVPGCGFYADDPIHTQPDLEAGG
jgi:hypothetical protein